jgi:hypothetical protein
LVPKPRVWQSIVQIDMLKIELFGTLQCRRYQKIRTAVQEAAAALGFEIELEEINDSSQFAQSNPLDLPRLYPNGELIAVRNPPKIKYLFERFQEVKI